MSKETLDIKCIGFKNTAFGDKMYYYKLNKGGNEYLLVNANMIRLLHMKWTERNEFEDSDLWDDFVRPITDAEKNITAAVESAEKLDYELKDKEENVYFTQHEIKILPKEDLPKRTEFLLEEDEVNDLMEIIRDNSNFLNTEKFFKLTKNMIEEAGADFVELEGYSAKFTMDGNHKNDGHLVEYSFELKSPSGKLTEWSTEMCLMVGWNYHTDLTINQ